MVELPIDTVLCRIIAHLASAPNLVVQAEPGAGKTTRVAPALLDSGLLARDHSILLLEPRRIAARAAARRIADERGGRVGDEIGYQVRFDDRTSRTTRLAVLTEGLLTRRLHHDPCLDRVGAVLLDEFHERSIHTDLALAFLREIQETVRPDLKIVVMSATLDPGPVSTFLGGCPVVRVEGRLHPVEIRWLDRPDDRPLIAQVVSAVVDVVETGGDGHVLVFLPGAPEIRRAAAALAPILENRVDLCPLHGDLSPEDQDRAISPGERRKVILATNVAQTSLTIDGVTTVVDTGLSKVPRHDPARGMDRLELVRISRASAAQRAGRAGRTRPGLALRLWTRSDDARRQSFDSPEIARIDLAPPLLEVLGFSGRDPQAFGWFESPPGSALARAMGLLSTLGAIEPGSHRLTARGEQLRALPVHPRLAACLVASRSPGAIQSGALAAALLSEPDLLRRSRRDGAAPTGPSDLTFRADLLEEGGGAIDPDTATAVRRTRNQLLRIARQTLGPAGSRAGHGAPVDDNPETDLMRSLLAGFPDRVCRRRAAGSDRVVMVGGRGARLDAASVVRTAPFLVAIEIEDPPGASESLIRLASAIDPRWLSDTGAVVEEPLVRFDHDRKAVEAVRVRRYHDLILEERPDPTADPDRLARALEIEAAKDPLRAIDPGEPARVLLSRVGFLRQSMPELGLPDLEGSGLTTLLPALCAGRRSFAELHRADLTSLIRAHLGPRLWSALECEAPERIAVPSNSQIRLRYEPDGPPVLAVRLFEMFGMIRTPRVAGGRVAIKIELLGPNMRPVQITQDLESFWQNTYPLVRKDLRARYPRHAWPEDPLAALPRKPGHRS